MTHSKYLQLKKNFENISKSQHLRDKLARKWVKKNWVMRKNLYTNTSQTIYRLGIT